MAMIATYTCGNVSVQMTHYPDFDEAVKKWEERKRKINWYNIFVTMMTNDLELLQQFDELPYGKKVCFVPFKSDLDSAYYVNTEKALRLNPNIKREKVNPQQFTWEIVNRSAIKIFATGNDKLENIITGNAQDIMAVTLANEIIFTATDTAKEWDINGEKISLGVERI